MQKLTLTALGLVIASGAAHAGSLDVAPSEPLVIAPVAPAPAAPAQLGGNWTGAYAGASLGFGATNVEGSDVLEDPDNTDLLDLDVDGDGAIGGVYGGYNYDFGRFVMGGEIDLNAANLDFDDDDFDDFVDGNDDDGGASIDQIHRAKLRAGYDAGRTLVYGTVGAAYAEADISGDDYSDTGYLVGAGVEYAVTERVNIGGEVLYQKFDDFDDTGIDFETTTAQARVSFRF